MGTRRLCPHIERFRDRVAREFCWALGRTPHVAYFQTMRQDLPEDADRELSDPSNRNLGAPMSVNLAVDAGEGYVLPSQGREVPEVLIGYVDALAA